MSTNIFSQEQLRKIVDDQLKASDLPKDHKVAVVGTVDRDGAQAIAVFTKSTVDGDWQFSAGARHEWTGDNSVGAKVVFSR